MPKKLRNKKRLKKPISTILLTGILLLVIFLFGAQTFKIGENNQNSLEKTIANADNGGTAEFVEQVRNSSGEWVENAGSPIFDNKIVASLPQKPSKETIGVLSSHISADGSEKWIEVDLSDFKLYAWEGNRKVYEFSVSTGRPGYKTITGEFRVWRKVRNQAYRGGSKARGDYYYLPNVPYSLFFQGGYAIHGTYWHNDFGIQNRSSGCVNLRIPDAEQIYNWAGPAMPSGVGAINSTSANPGVRVIVHE